VWVAAEFEHAMGGSGKKRANPSLPRGGLDTVLDDRGHDHPQFSVSSSHQAAVDSEPNIKAENMFVNQHIKRGLEEALSKYKKDNPSHRIMLVVKRDYTTRAQLYTSPTDTYTYVHPNGTTTDYQVNPLFRPKRQHLYVFIEGKPISHMTFKNSKYIQSGKPRRGMFHPN
jgi:hypothetical protein